MNALLGASWGRYFHQFLIDFCNAKCSQVVIKLEFNNERTWKSVFLTNLRFLLVKTTIGRVAHVEVGRKNDEQLKKKSIKNRSKIEAQDGSPLGIDFLLILGAKMRPSWHQNPPKIEAKRQSILGFNF